jgi:hypothetical protein
MILRLLKLPFRLVGFVLGLAVVLAFFEVVGLSVYLEWAGEPGLQILFAGGVTLTEVVTFLTANRERSLVAGGLAVPSLLLVLFGGEPTSVPSQE